MKMAPKGEQLLRLAFLGIILTLLYTAILVPLGFLEQARLRSMDAFPSWRNAIRSPPAAAKEILLVTIDEESQRRLQKKWPWDRAVFASFLEKLGQGPKLVLFDLVLAGESDPSSDAALAQAIRGAPPVLLACYLDENGKPVLPLPLFTEAGGILGSINKPRDGDHAVRRLWSGMPITGMENPVYAIELQASCLASGIPLSEIRIKKDGLWMGKLKIPVEQPGGALAINPLLPPSRIATLPFWKVIEGDFSPEQVRGKIVLLGTSSEITHDVYPTSFGIIPGVIISANAIVTILSGEFLKPIPPAVALVASGLVTFLALYLTFHLPVGWGLVALAGVCAASVAGGFLTHLFFDYRVESLSLVLLAVLSWLCAMFYQYGLLFAETIRLHRQVITDPSSGAHSARYLVARAQSTASSLAKRRKPLGFCAVRVEKPSDQLQRSSLDETEKQMRHLAHLLEQSKPAGGIAGRLAEDLFGVLLPCMTGDQARSWAEGLRKELRSTPEVLGIGTASTDGDPKITVQALIHSAETQTGVELSQAVLAPGAEGGRLDFVAWELEERNTALEKALRDLRIAHREMEQHFLEVTKSLVSALETKDEYTAGHLERVSRYATRLAEMLKLPPQEVEAVREAALLHDIGKIGIPDEVLHKVGALTSEEVALIRQHLSIGAKILEPMKFFRPITTIIYHHHERFDGKGYPHGLTGEFIPPGAQIITIADSFDAMTTSRSYNKPKTAQEALGELGKGSGTQFNPQFVQVFIELIRREGPHLSGHQAP